MKRNGKVVNATAWREGRNALRWAALGCHWADGSIRRALVERATALLRGNPEAVAAVGRAVAALRVQHAVPCSTQGIVTEAVLGTATYAALCAA